jgi:hypothetical protein
MYAGATTKVIHRVAVDAGRREGNGQQQGRDADANEIGREDKDRDDDLNAYPATGLAFGGPSEQPGPVCRGLWQPAALSGDYLQKPAQPLRDGSCGHHRGVSLIRLVARA